MELSLYCAFAAYLTCDVCHIPYQLYSILPIKCSAILQTGKEENNNVGSRSDTARSDLGYVTAVKYKCYIYTAARCICACICACMCLCLCLCVTDRLTDRQLQTMSSLIQSARTSHSRPNTPTTRHNCGTFQTPHCACAH